MFNGFVVEVLAFPGLSIDGTGLDTALACIGSACCGLTPAPGFKILGTATPSSGRGGKAASLSLLSAEEDLDEEFEGGYRRDSFGGVAAMKP